MTDSVQDLRQFLVLSYHVKLPTLAITLFLLRVHGTVRSSVTFINSKNYQIERNHSFWKTIGPNAKQLRDKKISTKIVIDMKLFNTRIL